MFGRATHSVIPVRIKKCTTYGYSRQQRRSAVKRSYDKHVRSSSPLAINTRVYFQSPEKTEWQRGKFVTKLNSRSYIVQSNNGARYRRNRIHCRSDNSITTTHPAKHDLSDIDDFDFT